MRSLLIVVFSVLLLSCGTNQYKGANAGYLVMGVGAAKDNPSKTIFKIYKYNPIKSTFTDFDFEICKNQRFLNGCKPDYENQSELGIVLVAKLEPGDYDIGWFETGYGNVSMKNTEHLGIRFTIKPNQTTYIGNNQTNIDTSKTLWWKSPKSVAFYLTDRKDQDIAYAKLNYPEISTQNVVSALPDLNTLSGKIYFITDKPPTSK